MASIIYVDAVHKGIWLMSTSTSGSPQHVARNLAFVAAGIYLWEGVQCVLVVCSVDDGQRPASSGEDSDSKPSSYFASQGSSRSRFRPSSSWAPDSAFPVFNAIAQLAYILLRISTFLALLSILVILNSLDNTTSDEISAFPVSNCTSEEETENSNSWCRIRLALMLGISVAPLLSSGFSNLLVMLRVASMWTQCGCNRLSLTTGSEEGIPQHSSGQRDLHRHLSIPQSHQSYRNCRVIAFMIPVSLLHLAQYVLIAFVGLAESRTVSGVSGSTNRRRLVIGTFAYSVLLDALALSLTFIGIIRRQNFGCDRACMYKARSNLYQERSSSPVFAHPCGHPLRSDCATEGGVSSYGTLSDMSFAQKSNICTSDSEETDSEISAEGKDYRIKDTRRSRSPKSSVDCKSLDCSARDNSRNGMDRISPLPREYKHENKTEYAEWVERTSEAMVLRRIRGTGVESRIACSEESRVEKQKGWMPGIGTVIFTEGRHQGLLWMSASVFMKIGVLTARVGYFVTSFDGGGIDLFTHVKVDDGLASTLDFQSMRFYSLALTIMSIASGRLFLLMTRASPIGDGYMEARDPSPLWSPSASLLDVGIMTPPVVEDRPRRPSLSYQARPITLVRLDVLPAYVERRLYTRRVRHEREAAAGGAVRTIGGSVILPPPTLVSVGSKVTREKRKKAEGETSVQIPYECAGMSGTRPTFEPERKGYSSTCNSNSTN